MLKKIPTSQARLGMFLQSMEGSWLSHPFWKTKFVLQEQADLDALLRSGVPAVWIDPEKGLDLAQDGTPSATVVAATAAVIAAMAAAPAPERPVPVAMAQELERAKQVMGRSREMVKALFSEARLGRAVDAQQCLPLVEEVAQSLARNPSALISLARLKNKDDYTYMHSVAVCTLMVSLAQQLGLSEQETREAGLAGLLHDIGKVLVPATLLNKAGTLSDAEFAVIRTHPRRGYQALKEGGAVPESALDVCLHHHEKYDGSGYPDKIGGEKISLLARMGAICDVYDAITSHRPYKSAWDPASSIQRMAQWKGHFDGAIFQAFVKSVGIYPVGTLVKLQSGRLAVVIDQNAASLITPVVRVFFSTQSNMPISLEVVDLSRPEANDRVLSRELPHDWGFTQLDDLWRKP